jgi:hypothetical protein
VIGSFFPADPPQFHSVPFTYRFEPIKESLIDAGFASISATVLTSQKEFTDLTLLARGLVYGGPTIDLEQRGGVDAIARNFRDV